MVSHSVKMVHPLQCTILYRGISPSPLVLMTLFKSQQDLLYVVIFIIWQGFQLIFGIEKNSRERVVVV